jgi:RHS repeat-associated protein
VEALQREEEPHLLGPAQVLHVGHGGSRSAPCLFKRGRPARQLSLIGFLAVALQAAMPVVAQTQIWTKIADEGASFTVSGTQTVRYGAGISWVQLAVSGTGQCTNAYFGSDPINGTVKQCEVLSGGAVVANLVANPSFETPGLGNGNYSYDTAGAVWQFYWAGITANASPFTYASPAAPDGTQAAFIQGATGTATQTITLSAGTYSLTFKAVQRGGVYQSGTQIVRASIDGVTVGSYQPPQDAYGTSPSYAFTLGSGTHTLQLAGSGSGSDFTAFVDSVSIVSTGSGSGGTLPAPPVSPMPVVNYEYDAQGNPTRTIQAPGVVGFNLTTANTYDALNRAKDITDARAGVTRFAYNGREDLTQVTDPRVLVTQSPRNGLGDVTSLSSPDTGTASNTYDAASNLQTRTDSRSVVATYGYDPLNRLTGVVYTKAGQTSLAYGWTYDQTGAGFSYGVGRLTSTDHPNGSTQYAYDPQGRVVADTQRINAAAGANGVLVSKTVGYAYDPAGHVTSITYPSGRVLGIAYTAGQPTGLSLAKDSSSTGAALLSAIQWEPFGAVKSWQWETTGGAQANERLYDSAGRLVRYQLGKAVRDLTYDDAGRIAKYTHYDAASAAAAPTLDQSFTYDELSRLTRVTASSTSWSIDYDPNGNRTGVTLNGTSSAYTTSPTSNRLLSMSNPARNFGYDDVGNTTSDTGGYTSTYDLSGRMSTLSRAGITAFYSLDGMGRRVRKFTTAGAATTVVFVYDQQGQLLGEYDSAGNAIREYVWLGSTPVAMFTPDAGNASNPPVVYYIHTDHLEAPRVLMDRNNAVRWRWLAEPFGTSAPETNPSSLGALTYNLRLPGQYADQESGLNYNTFRDYDASIGRYVQSDPLGVLPGVEAASPGLSRLSPRLRAKLSKVVFQLNQPYAYVDSNPVSRIDPDGLEPTTLGRIGLGAARGGLGGARGGLLGIGLGIGIGAMAEMCSPTDRDRDERQCDADYEAGRDFCHSMAVTKGRHKGTKKYAETYSQCMRAVDEEYVECYQGAGK